MAVYFIIVHSVTVRRMSGRVLTSTIVLAARN
jgi:hypothetical protein